MHWVYIIFFGATLNVIVNFGYKVLAADIPLGLIGAIGFGFAAFFLTIYGIYKRDNPRPIIMDRTPVYLGIMGVGAGITGICFLSALATGPISLIDPMWACIYSLVSLFIGMVLIRERPNLIAIIGISLYLAGAVMMSRG